MKQFGKFLTVFLIILSILSIFTTIYANSTEPPCLTVIVSFPVEDLSLSIRFSDGTESNALLLKEDSKAWETYYRFFSNTMGFSRKSLESAMLIVESSEKSFECKLPETTFKQYNNLLTLDFKNEIISVGYKPLRNVLLVSMRVLLTLLIEGLIFLAFRYKNKSSWIAFIIINLITQSALNISIYSIINSYWIFGYVFYEIIIFIVEIIAFSRILKEHNKDRAIAYALIANFASLILGSLLIGYLPV